jgi:hypothetical protein
MITSYSHSSALAAVAALALSAGVGFAAQPLTAAARDRARPLADVETKSLTDLGEHRDGTVRTADFNRAERAEIQFVDRRGGHDGHDGRGHNSFSFGLSFGGGYPYYRDSYYYRPYYYRPYYYSSPYSYSYSPYYYPSTTIVYSDPSPQVVYPPAPQQPTVVYTQPPNPQPVVVQQPQPVPQGQYAAPEPSVNPWSALAHSDAAAARDVFMRQVDRDSLDGVAKVGLALALADSTDLAGGVNWMRRAVSVDPQSLRRTPLDQPLREKIQQLIVVYRDRGNDGPMKADALFMVAALDTIQGEYTRAAGSIHAAAEVGDSRPTTTALRRMIEREIDKAPTSDR